MDVADQILKAAEKLLAAKGRAERAAEEYRTAQTEYRDIVAQLTANGDEPIQTQAPKKFVGKGSLRERITQYMMSNGGVPLSVVDIESAVGAEGDHKRVVWTLANMRRDGLIKHEERGVWSMEKEKEEPRGDPDIDF